MNQKRNFCLGLSIKSLFVGLFALGGVLFFGSPTKATDFTLSELAIQSLDDNMSNLVSQFEADIFNASILSSQDIPGTGVVFTIHFPSTNLTDSMFFWTSNSSHGNGTLVGLDVSAYTNFDLKFTVLSIDGSTNATESLEMGTVIGPFHSSPYAYHPDIASLTGDFPPSVVSTISVTSATITDIGFVVNEWPAGSWSNGPHDVTILVQPAEGAVQLPEIIVANVTLAPAPDTNIINQLETVVATVTTNGSPAPGALVDFFIIAGPNVGNHGTATTDVSGLGTFTYTGTGSTGMDSILATGTIDGLSFTGTASVVWIDTNVPPATLTYEFSNLVQKCKSKSRINKTAMTTNVTTTCNLSLELVVTNTGVTNTPAFPVMIWTEQGSVFDSSSAAPLVLTEVKALKEDKIDKIKLKHKFDSNQSGVFIFATDTNNHVLTSIQIE